MADASGTRPALKPCGTFAAYKRHLKRGDKPCDACAQANRDRHNARYKLNRAGRAPYISKKSTRMATCPECLSRFDTTTATAVYCSQWCRWRVKGRRRPTATNVHKGHIQGAIRPIIDGIPFIGPSRLLTLHCRAVVVGGWLVDCPWCGDVTDFRMGQRGCVPCGLLVSIEEKPL